MYATTPLERGRAMTVLGRWLGPWAASDAAPRDTSLAIVDHDSGVSCWVHRPRYRRPSGAILLVGGLHYAGPQDPRLDRFLKVLASAGMLVVAPMLRDFERLTLAPRLHEDALAGLEVLLSQPDRPAGRVGVFSISFGSLLALSLAGGAANRHIAGTVLFGGYADWYEAFRFSLTGVAAGAGSIPRDPLNQPVSFINLLPHLPIEADWHRALGDAWLAYCKATWGRPEMKQGDRHKEVARRMARRLPDAIQSLFLVGTGAEPGGVQLAEEALDAAREGLAWLDPTPHLRTIDTPVHVIHGADDDVIPWTHAARLARALPASATARTYVTGLYGHTGSDGLVALFTRVPTALRELGTMAAMLRAIVDVATTR